MRALYLRMPAILSAEAFERWLAIKHVRLGPAPEDLRAMLRVGRQHPGDKDDWANKHQWFASKLNDLHRVFARRIRERRWQPNLALFVICEHRSSSAASEGSDGAEVSRPHRGDCRSGRDRCGQAFHVR